jgi:hypothetical protein
LALAHDVIVVGQRRAGEGLQPIAPHVDPAQLGDNPVEQRHHLGEGAGDKPWPYLLVPETAVLSNATISGLMATHTRSVDADLISSCVLTETVQSTVPQKAATEVHQRTFT